MGFEYGLPSLISSNQTISGAQNVVQNQGAPPINAMAGNIIQDNKLFINRRLNLFWEFPELRCVQASQSCKMDDMVNMQLQTKSNGSFKQLGGVAIVPPNLL